MSSEDLQSQIDELTYDLKTMESNDSRYARIWDERVALKLQLADLQKTVITDVTELAARPTLPTAETETK